MKRKIISYNSKLKILARNKRNNSTKSEVMLWQRLRDKQMMGYDFDRQKPVDNYILDFFCYDLMLGIELDGLTHSDEHVYTKDILKEKRLTELGIAVLRFNNYEVLNDIENVIRAIEVFAERMRE